MKYLIYIECLIIFTFYNIIISLVKQLQRIGLSSEWYANRGIHAFQGRKALAQYNKEHKEEIERQLKELNGG